MIVLFRKEYYDKGGRDRVFTVYVFGIANFSSLGDNIRIILFLFINHGCF